MEAGHWPGRVTGVPCGWIASNGSRLLAGRSVKRLITTASLGWKYRGILGVSDRIDRSQRVYRVRTDHTKGIFLGAVMEGIFLLLPTTLYIGGKKYTRD